MKNAKDSNTQKPSHLSFEAIAKNIQAAFTPGNAAAAAGGSSSSGNGVGGGRSWFAMCLLDFDRHFTRSFLPSMPDDDMAAVTRGLKERLQWYTCPRGHPYTVGNCGRPMEQAYW